MNVPESAYYRWQGEDRTCVGKNTKLIMYNVDFLPPVHGFQRPTYTVLEGESVEIVFQRNAKGQTRFPRLSLYGIVTSHGDPTGGLEMLYIISTHTKHTHVCIHTFLHFFLLLPT